MVQTVRSQERARAAIAMSCLACVLALVAWEASKSLSSPRPLTAAGSLCSVDGLAIDNGRNEFRFVHFFRIPCPSCPFPHLPIASRTVVRCVPPAAVKGEQVSLIGEFNMAGPIER